MRNIDYICTLDLEDFHAVLCCILEIPVNGMWGQILKSWLESEVDDEFFESPEAKREYVDTFNNLLNMQQNANKISKDSVLSMFEALYKYFEQKGMNDDKQSK